MPYAVELYLDEEASAAVERIKVMLSDNSTDIDQGTRPHVSLSIYADLPILEFENEVRRFAKKLSLSK
ncbi:MAG TPA: hypothetical protein GX528_08710 [Firmicutes bacterium]|nr:hypothetical protein [Bacillota bacterium]